MSLKICYTVPFAAMVLLFILALPAFSEDDSTSQAPSFGDVKYKVLDPIQLSKEAKPLYKVDAFFRLRDLREIATRDRDTYIVPSKADQDPSELGKEAKPLYDVASYFRIKKLREIATRDKGTYIVPSKTDQVPSELGKEAKPLYDVDSYFRKKDIREIGSKKKKSFVVPSKIRA